MTTSKIFVPTAQLPGTIASALGAIGFRKADVQVEACDTFTMSGGGLTGTRAFVALVDLATGRFEKREGNYGGSNAFTTNPVDDDHSAHAIPVGVAVVKGWEGYGPTHCYVYVNPSNLAALLPQSAESSGLTDRQRAILATFKGYTSAGRKRVFGIESVRQIEIDALADLGLVRVASNGAACITTAGKNAIGDSRGFRGY